MSQSDVTWIEYQHRCLDRFLAVVRAVHQQAGAVVVKTDIDRSADGMLYGCITARRGKHQREPVRCVRAHNFALDSESWVAGDNTMSGSMSCEGMTIAPSTPPEEVARLLLEGL